MTFVNIEDGGGKTKEIRRPTSESLYSVMKESGQLIDCNLRFWIDTEREKEHIRWSAFFK